MSGMFLALLMRDIRLAGRIGGGGAMGVVFFLILVTITPFAIGPDLNLLARIGPAILWIAALLATLLGLDRLFQADQEDGSLDVLRMADAPLELVVVSKCVAHWLTTCLPLVLAAPLFGLMLALEWDALIALAATLVVGTPALTFLGSIGAALTASLRRGGLLMAILILPLTIPVLIFGVSAASSVTVATSPFWPPFFILGALSLASLALAPFAAAGALRALSE
ncbi:MAG: heme exporter protein CcmB [Beijerinckiaceae bacterium]|jgi:heme exporter protein B